MAFSLASNRKVEVRQAADRQGNKQLLYGMAAFFSLGLLLFGIDQGQMGMIVADERWLDQFQPANSWVTGAVVSLYDIGCMFGALLSGFFSDKYGRERMLAYASIFFAIGAVLQSCSYTIPQIIVGRIVIGFGVGSASAEVPLYLSEIAPCELRGRFNGISQMVLCFGEMLAFWGDYGFNFLDTPHWWRIPIALQLVPVIIMGVGAYLWVLPSPRWLAMQDRRDEAYEVMVRFHGTEKAREEFEIMVSSMDQERRVGEATWREVFQMPLFKVTYQTSLIQFFQQSTATISVMYYTPMLYEKAGIADAKTRNLLSGTVGIALWVTSFLPILFFDKLGRKTWLQIGCVGMNLALIGIVVCQWSSENNPGSNGNYAIVVMPYIFYIFFNLSWAPGSWTFASEAPPLRMRAKCNSVATAVLWLAAFLNGQLAPVINDAIGWGLYVIYIGINTISFLFVRFVIIETRGVPLEEMAKRMGIDYSEVGLPRGVQAYHDNVDDDDNSSKGSVEIIETRV